MLCSLSRFVVSLKILLGLALRFIRMSCGRRGWHFARDKITEPSVLARPSHSRHKRQITKDPPRIIPPIPISAADPTRRGVIAPHGSVANLLLLLTRGGGTQKRGAAAACFTRNDSDVALLDFPSSAPAPAPARAHQYVRAGKST